MTELEVSLYDTRIATITTTRNGALSLRHWDGEALGRWGPASPILSVAVPLGERLPDDTLTSFIDNLLPEVRRDYLAVALGLTDTSVGALLAELGRDCAGAVTVVASDELPDERQPSLRTLSTDELQAMVLELPRRPLGIGRGVRHSLAGLQGKLLLVRTDAGWALPLDGHPSTHILKPEPLDIRFGMAGNELLCTRLAVACDLTQATCTVEDIAGLQVFVTSRFDRHEGDGGIERLHQEDLCQAFGRPVAAKYEVAGERLLARTATLLSQRARRGDVRKLAEYVAFNVAIGNTDAHCKNIGLLHPPDGTIELAPLYDVAHLVRDGAPVEPGMSVNGVRSILDITGADLVREVVGWKVRINEAQARSIVTDLLERLREAVPAVASEVWVDEEIVDSIVTRTAELLGSM